MSNAFEILVNTSEKVLAGPPQQFAHLNVLYAPFILKAGSTAYPNAGWCDFAGVWLFRWYQAVWELSEQKCRGARLPFWYTYEAWLRRTPAVWWKVSLVRRHVKKTITEQETLVFPERVEVAILTATQQLLAGAKRASVWTEDCAALEKLINDPAGYLNALACGAVQIPRFLTSDFKIPMPPVCPKAESATPAALIKSSIEMQSIPLGHRITYHN